MKAEIPDSNVRALPVAARPDPNGRPMLNPVDRAQCQHRGSFTLDADAGKCFCDDCNGEVSPMFVLDQLMKEESRWMRTRSAYRDEMKRLAERSRTKCEKCGQITGNKPTSEASSA